MHVILCMHACAQVKTAKEGLEWIMKLETNVSDVLAMVWGPGENETNFDWGEKIFHYENSTVSARSQHTCIRTHIHSTK
jgi:hypothetical protein